MNNNPFTEFESNVRSYCRVFPTQFTSASGLYLYDTEGNKYLDFLAGAGTLNYGHNHPIMKSALVEYLVDDGILHSLDLYTTAKMEFINAFQSLVLKPLNFNYKLQFVGPTGANSVESALKLARKITGRNRIVAFTGAFHGMSLGALSVSAKEEFDGLLPGMEVTRYPYEGFTTGVELELLEQLIEEPSGIAKPAAFIVETTQCEGGLNVASNQWLQKLSSIARKHDILLIIDDIQVGCGRTGSFFSFTRAGIESDIICLSKSLSGIGLPMALMLLKPEIDQWSPGEHNGTFRGNNLAFVTARVALEEYWKDVYFSNHVKETGKFLGEKLLELKQQFPTIIEDVRGIGLVQGLRFFDKSMASLVSKKAFESKIIIETCGAYDEVLKFLPPLIISKDILTEAISTIQGILSQVDKTLVTS